MNAAIPLQVKVCSSIVYGSDNESLLDEIHQMSYAQNVALPILYGRYLLVILLLSGALGNAAGILINTLSINKGQIWSGRSSLHDIYLVYILFYNFLACLFGLVREAEKFRQTYSKLGIFSTHKLWMIYISKYNWVFFSTFAQSSGLVLCQLLIDRYISLCQPLLYTTYLLRAQTYLKTLPIFFVPLMLAFCNSGDFWYRAGHCFDHIYTRQRVYYAEIQTIVHKSVRWRIQVDMFNETIFSLLPTILMLVLAIKITMALKNFYRRRFNRFNKMANKVGPKQPHRAELVSEPCLGMEESFKEQPYQNFSLLKFLKPESRLSSKNVIAKGRRSNSLHLPGVVLSNLPLDDDNDENVSVKTVVSFIPTIKSLHPKIGNHSDKNLGRKSLLRGRVTTNKISQRINLSSLLYFFVYFVSYTPSSITIFVKHFLIQANQQLNFKFDARAIMLLPLNGANMSQLWCPINATNKLAAGSTIIPFDRTNLWQPSNHSQYTSDMDTTIKFSQFSLELQDEPSYADIDLKALDKVLIKPQEQLNNTLKFGEIRGNNTYLGYTADKKKSNKLNYLLSRSSLSSKKLAKSLDDNLREANRIIQAELTWRYENKCATASEINQTAFQHIRRAIGKALIDTTVQKLVSKLRPLYKIDGILTNLDSIYISLICYVTFITDTRFKKAIKNAWCYFKSLMKDLL